MDPITLIGLVASVTNLVHATKSIVRVIGDFKDGNQQIINLLQDATAFGEALGGFDRVLRSRHTSIRISGSVIENILNKATNTLKDLEDWLLQVASSKSSTVRRARWVQHSSGINKLHLQLKEQNTMLQTFLSIAHTLEALPYGVITGITDCHLAKRLWLLPANTHSSCWFLLVPTR